MTPNTHYHLAPVEYALIADMALQAFQQSAFLPIRGEGDSPFLLNMQAKYAGDPEFQIFALQQSEDPQVEQQPPVGFIIILPSDGQNYRAIGPMYIRSSQRGKGLGRLQVQLLIAWARNNQIEYLFTQTWGANHASQRIFEGLGFTLVRSKPNTRVNGDASLTYALQI